MTKFIRVKFTKPVHMNAPIKKIVADSLRICFWFEFDLDAEQTIILDLKYQDDHHCRTRKLAYLPMHSYRMQ
ncbi:hypothetical protein QE152_g15177 [Popillia japonica]|uniref:Transposase n=1 Tax=Popillia japonica TaxID=7064 RepID=A0AAW1L8P4_POPJA